MSEYRILFVCTGNVCRSPIAEILTRRILRQTLGDAATRFAVASAGIAATGGSKMDARSAAALAAHGLGGAADRFRARRLDAGMVVEADLVLAVERAHRRDVVTLEPSALPKTFCFRELVRLLAMLPGTSLPDDPVARARTAVELARQQRGLHGYAQRDDDAIPDPMARPFREHRATAELIAATASSFADFLSAPRKDV